MDLKGKKLLICEEALTGFKGHYYTWIKAIRHIHASAGAEVMVAGNILMDESIRDEFKANPAYSTNSWSGIYNHPKAWRRYANVFRHNLKLFMENRKLFRQTGKVDCVVLTAARIYHLIAWYFLCRLYLGKYFDRAVFFVLTSEAVYDQEHKNYHFKASSKLIGSIIRRMSGYVQSGKVVFAGDSHITCGEYEVLTGVPFRVFPSPGAGLAAGSQGCEEQHEVPHIVFLGVSVIDKGIDLLQDAILQLLDDDPDLKARFIIQWATKTIDYSGNNVDISPELRHAEQVELLEHTLDDASYRYYLQSADVMVLPYRRLEYFNKISGVAVEAAIAGVPMIVTENTWLSWAMDEYGTGLTVKDGDVRDLKEKIAYAIRHWRELKMQAEARISTALELNSSERYLRNMWTAHIQ
ncbi:MAG: glycosyltransferase [Sphingobacteriales bacterium]|jgi:glycosyltransferase involved in cell wall biosynthesis